MQILPVHIDHVDVGAPPSTLTLTLLAPESLPHTEPKMTADSGARCSTMPSPRVLDKRSSAEAEENQKQPRLMRRSTVKRHWME